MEWFKNLKISPKIQIPVMLGFVVIMLNLYFLILPRIEDNIMQEKRNTIKGIVESSVSMIEYYENQAMQGKITKDEAMEKISNIVYGVRFEGDNYIFVNDFDKMIFHGVNQKLEGRKLDQFKDVNNKIFLVEAANNLKNSAETFVEYAWSKPKVEGDFPKLAYSKKTKHFNLIVSTGVYIDEVQAIIAETNNSIFIHFLVIIVLLQLSLWFIIKFTITKPMNNLANISNNLADGNLSSNYSYKSKDEIGGVFDSIKKVTSTLKELTGEINSLTLAASEGKLDYRGNSSNFKGSYSELIVGINQTLDAIISPLNVAAEYIDRISKGDIPRAISEDYKGDFNAIKNNINQCIASINYLIEDSNSLVFSAMEGKLNDRAKLDRHTGDFRRIIDGVNKTLDRLVGLIDNMPVPVQIISKDFDILYVNEAGKNLN